MNHVADRLRPLPPGSARLEGPVDDAIRRCLDRHLKILDHRRLVDWFRNRINPFAAGEFWGKTVRSACPLCAYTGDAELRALIARSVDDLLSTQDANGCISTRTRDQQPLSSDLWERKYVLLGLLAWHEISGEERVLDAMVRMADHTLSQVGPAPKRRIVDTGWAFEGIESSSILEPILLLHRLTGHARYLDFARYIVEEEGACRRGSIFAAALAGVPPRAVNGTGVAAESIAKAYESLSCFEGLVEYHRITGEVRWREAALAYHRMVSGREITVIGSGGGEGPHNAGPGKGEQWNDLAFDQADLEPRLMMETCVTVTWMKYCLQILRLTGDPALVDQIECSLHNALLGALKPSGDAWDYFQNLRGTRGNTVNFASDIAGFQLSCCTANGPMGLAIIPGLAVMASDAGAAVNLYLPGGYTVPVPGGELRLAIATDYPRDGAVAITVEAAPAQPCAIALRIPAWSAHTALTLNRQAVAAQPGTYATLARVWAPGDRLDLRLDLGCRLLTDPRGASHALACGPLILARDRRLDGDGDAAVMIAADAAGRVAAETITPQHGAQVQRRIPTTDGGSFPVLDYASAGSTWDETSRFRVWLPATPN